MVNVSRISLNNARKNSGWQLNLLNYLDQVVGFDLAFDTGYKGNVIQKIMEYIGVDPNDPEFYEKLILICTHNPDINHIKLDEKNDLDFKARKEMVEKIESLPKKNDRVLFIDENGKPFFRQNNPEEKLLAYVCESAICRYFLPKI